MRSLRLTLRRLSRRASGFEILIPLHAIAAAGIVALFALVQLMGIFALNQAFTQLSGTDKWVSVNYDGRYDDVTPEIADSTATNQLARLSSEPQTNLTTYRPVPDHKSSSFQLVGTSDLASVIALTDGRLPETCTPTLCEVLSIDTGAGDPSVAANGLVIVGHATLLPGAPDLALMANNSVLINGMPEEVNNITGLALFPRIHTWARPLDPQMITHLGISPFLDTSADAANQLRNQSPLLRLIVPESQISSVADHSSFGQRRILNWILAISFLAVFSTALIASAQKMKHTNSLRVLEQNEWSRPAQTWISFLTIALPSLIGFGVASTLGVVAVRTYVEQIKGYPDAIHIPQVISVVALTWFVGVLLGLCTLHTSRRTQSLAWIATIAGVLALAVGIATDVSAIAIPLVVTGATVGALARKRRSRRSSLSANIASNNKSLIGSSLSLLAFVVSLVVLMMVTFSTLSRNIDDHAIFKSPIASRITGQVTQPFAIGSLQDFSTLTSGGSVTPIVKIPTTARLSTVEGLPVQLLGLPRDLVAQLPDLSHQTGQANTTLDLLDIHTPVVGTELPTGQTLTANVSGLHRACEILVWLIDAQGESQSTQLVVRNGVGTAKIGNFIGPLHFLGFDIYENPSDLSRRQHALSEGNNEVEAPQGTLNISNFAVDSQRVSLQDQFLAATPNAQTFNDGISIRYALEIAPLYVSSVKVPDTLPVIVDPTTAGLARDNKLSLSISTTSAINLDIVGTMTRFPTETPHFGLVDANTLSALFAAVDPAQINVAEIWSTGRLTDPTIVTKAPYTKLAFTDQKTLIDNAKNDEVRTWTMYSQIATAIVMALISLLVIRFLALSVRRKTMFIAWEAKGLTPWKHMRSLVLALIVRMIVTIAFAAAATVPLTYFATRFLTRDFTGTIAEPPLAPTAPWLWIGIAVAALIVVAKLITMVTAWRVTRGTNAYEVTR